MWQQPVKYNPPIDPPEEPEYEACPSCGGSMPVDGEGGYNCEVYLCEDCGQIVCEDCRMCPADFLEDREYLPLVKYFSDRGYKDTGSNDAVTHSYCKACLVGAEVSAIGAIPLGELLLHTNDKWYYEEARRAYNERLAKGE